MIAGRSRRLARLESNSKESCSSRCSREAQKGWETSEIQVTMCKSVKNLGPLEPRICVQGLGFRV